MITDGDYPPIVGRFTERLFDPQYRTVEVDCVGCKQHLICTYTALDLDPRFTCATCGRTYQIISTFDAETPLFQLAATLSAKEANARWPST